MFDTTQIHLRKDILETLISTGLLIPFKQPRSGVPDWYIVNNCANLTISWTSNSHFYELRTRELFMGTNNISTIKIRRLERNIGNVSVIIRNQLFFKYCLRLDYEKNEIGLAELVPF